MKFKWLLIFILFIAAWHSPKGKKENTSWIRINLLGYKPVGIKVAVWCNQDEKTIGTFQLIDSATNNIVYEAKAGKNFGAYGPFTQTYRLNFSSYNKPGKYYLRAGEAISPVFVIDDNAYKGAADFCLQYMRQQRSGYNPYLKDSCHTRDGYTMYGPMKDSTHIDVSGGWHDATDYLQYSTTSANATYHLLAAYRDFPTVFTDNHLSNGLAGKNQQADVLDEAKWGLDWLLKMHPRADWMFNQLADDRDHKGFRLPNKDSADYGKGFERPVYFCTGEPQGLGKYKNNATGTASTAGKFSSAFALGHTIFKTRDEKYSSLLKERSFSAYEFGLKKPGNCQTACNREPYFYEEDNWTDDMELASAELFNISGNQNLLTSSFSYAQQEKITAWLGADTARHYQWYPFINLGHYALSKSLKGNQQQEVKNYYKQGLEKVWQKAYVNAFYRGVPFIWCSNNLQTSFAIQCYWYRQTSNDNTYEEMEQACFDWLLGCNPWGSSMIVGLPGNGDYPDDPHSSLNYLYGYQTLGGLVDGPVYGSIFKKQRGVAIVRGDEYAKFQSDYVVYHDDYADYVTNEPTMDGTAALIYLLAAKESSIIKDSGKKKALTYDHGAITRADLEKKELALVFTGHEFADGAEFIIKTLQQEKIKASFFFTGSFLENPSFKKYIQQLKNQGNYIGAHSDQHLLYCDWTKRDSLLLTQEKFNVDLNTNYRKLANFGISKKDASYFLPPYEWYNDSIAWWTKSLGLQLINFSPGTLSNADYTTPDMKNYRTSEAILSSINKYEISNEKGFNGFILLIHIGTDPKRTDKLYNYLPAIIRSLHEKKYIFKRIDELLDPKRG